MSGLCSCCVPARAADCPSAAAASASCVGAGAASAAAASAICSAGGGMQGGGGGHCAGGVYAPPRGMMTWMPSDDTILPSPRLPLGHARGILCPCAIAQQANARYQSV